MRKLIVVLLAVTSVSAFSQHYVTQPQKPESKKLYENKPPKKQVSSGITTYRAALVEQIYRNFPVHDYHRGKSCQLHFTTDLEKRQLLDLAVYKCTMGRDFEQQLPQILSRAIATTPIPRDVVFDLAYRNHLISFTPRFNSPVKSDKPSSFSKTYVTPQK